MRHDSKNWMAAIQVEYDAIVKNGTWYLAYLSLGKLRQLVPSGFISSNGSQMVALIATRLDLLQKGMLKRRVLTLMRLFLPLVV